MWMHALALGLAAMSVDPEPAVTPEPLPATGGFGGVGHMHGFDGPYAGPLYGSGIIPVGPAARNPGLLACYPYSHSCRREFGTDRWGRPVCFPIVDHWCDSTCDMPMHQAYILLHPDNYYFRPYSLVHIREQREAVTALGGDPRHPYANEIFERVYDEWEAEQSGAETIPTPSESTPSEAPAPREEPLTNELVPPLPPNLQLNPVPPPPGTP